MSAQKVAVVTGSNKGIGFGVVTGLCEKFDGIVYLTSRDVKRGEEAIKKLKEKNLTAAYHQLDISDEKSILKLKEYILEKHGGIDILINNAGFAFKQNDKTPFEQQACVTLGINYFDTLCVCKTLFPILRPNARVVNVSSSMGHLSIIPTEALRTRFIDPNLTIPQLSALVNEFIAAAKEGNHVEKGWCNTAYGVSKVGVSALTIIQQRMFNNEPNKRNVQVNSVHPGYVHTDMTSQQGMLTIEEGSKAILYLALEPHNLYGKYMWHDCSLVDFDAPSKPALY